MNLQMINTTVNELNKAYFALLKADKMGAISRLSTQEVPFNKKMYKFMFDKSLGRKGSWICVTQMFVVDLDD